MLNLSIPDHVVPLRAKVLNFIEREIYPLEKKFYEETPESRRGLMKGLMQKAKEENLWALGMYIGGGGFFLSMALSVYTSRALGIKLSLYPKTKESIKFILVQIVIFVLLISGGRLVRLSGFEFGPHIAALISGILDGYLLYKQPSGEYVAKEESHG